MERINKQELSLVASKPETRAIEKNSLSKSSALILTGMLDLAAANAKYELSESEIEFWKRQMVGYPDALIEQFFSEHIAQSKWMPQFHDWHEWVEARNEQARYENKAYWEEYRRKQETVQAWRESPQYETEMAEIKRKLEAIVAKAKPVGTVSAVRPEIPLAMSPEKEREYLASFKKEGQQ